MYLLNLSLLGSAASAHASKHVQSATSFVNGASVGDWIVGDRASGTELLTLHVFIKHSPESRAELEQRLWAVSDPASADYGAHASFQHLNELLRPSPEAMAAVESWLAGVGVDPGAIRRTPAEDIWEVTVNVSSAEALLGAEYHRLGAESHRGILRTPRFTLPASVSAHVDTVGPTTRVPNRRRSKLAAGAERPSSYTSPPSLREMYGIEDVHASSDTQSTYAVCGFLDQFFDPSDVAYFFKTYDEGSVGKKVVVKGPNSGSTGMEATLDVCYGAAMAAGIETTFWSTGGRMPGHSDNEPLLQWLFDVASDASPPLVFAFSYSDNEDTVDADYAERVNVELQKAGARGLSIIESSGDGGVAGIQPDKYCPKGFMGTFPATSPWVTAVGGTGHGSKDHLPEAASTHYPSGGGFSNWQERPSYQDQMVQQYLAKADSLPSSSLYNSSKAGFPDVSLASEDYALSQYSISIPVDGTSASAPVFGAMVALLNDVRLASGKPALGWLNPLLYAHPEAFTDITQGSNPACGTGGFPTAEGWDPVTGLGTPKFSVLSGIVASLPAPAPEVIV